MFTSVASAILGSFGGISDKLNLNLNKVNGRTYASLLFIAMSVMSGLFVLIFGSSLNTVTPYSLSILLLIIGGSVVQNILFYSGLAKKNLSAVEPIINMEPITAILNWFQNYEGICLIFFGKLMFLHQLS